MTTPITSYCLDKAALALSRPNFLEAFERQLRKVQLSQNSLPELASHSASCVERLESELGMQLPSQSIAHILIGSMQRGIVRSPVAGALLVGAYARYHPIPDQDVAFELFQYARGELDKLKTNHQIEELYDTVLEAEDNEPLYALP